MLTRSEIRVSAARPVSSLTWFASPVGVAVIFAMGLLLRLLIAPHTGQFDDAHNYFQPEAACLVTTGPADYYSTSGCPGDAPGYLTVLWPFAVINKLLTGSVYPSLLVVKLPAIIADLGLAWIAGTFGLRLRRRRQHDATANRQANADAAANGDWAWRAGIAAAVLFNPAVLWVSTLWGQSDLVGATVMLCALLLLFTGRATSEADSPTARRNMLLRRLAGMALAGLAVAIKPQTGLALPAVALALVWLDLRRGRLSGVSITRFVAGGAALLVGFFAVGIPFGLGVAATLQRYQLQSQLNRCTGMWSFNLWGVLGPWQQDTLTSRCYGTVSTLYVLGRPAFYVGAGLMVIALAVLGRLAWRALNSAEVNSETDARPQAQALLMLLASVASAALAFALMTRMWERYLLVTLALMAPLTIHKRWRRPYLLLSVAAFLGVYYHYVSGAQCSPNLVCGQSAYASFGFTPIYRWLLGGPANTAANTWNDTLVAGWQSRIISLLVLAGLLKVAYSGWQSNRSAVASAI